MHDESVELETRVQSQPNPPSQTEDHEADLISIPVQEEKMMNHDDDSEEEDEVRIFEHDPMKIALTWKNVVYNVGISPQTETNPWARMANVLHFRKRAEKENVSKESAKVVPVRRILDDDSGEALPGQLLAIMGPSGCGKTTLLNALGGRIEIESGSIRFNDKERTKALKRKIGYVLQDDLLHSSLTVRETLTFTAFLRLPSSMATTEKYAIVDKTIKALGLQKCQHSIIGNVFARGISGGERKRVNIGIEMLNNPSILLLDEPTSGLDSHIAMNMMKLLRRFALEGRTVVCSIHQPSSQIFSSFDKVMFLAQGSVVYYGKPEDLVPHFYKIGYACYPNWNAADFALEMISKKDDTPQKLIEAYKKRLGEASASGESSEVITSDDGTSGQKWQTTWKDQFLILSKRAYALNRGLVLSWLQFNQHFLIGLLVGLLWFQLPVDTATVMPRQGVIFFQTAWLVFSMSFDKITSYPMERAVITKERATGSYRLSPYFLSKSFSELPFQILYPTLYAALVYPLAGLNPKAEAIAFHFLTVWLASIVAESMGTAIAASVMDIQKSIVLATVSFLLLLLVGGFYIEPDQIPVWIRWVQWISPFRYIYLILVNIEFDSRTFTCSNPLSDISTYGSCPVAGDQVLSSSGLDVSNAISVGALIAMTVVLKVFSYFSLKRLTSSNAFQ